MEPTPQTTSVILAAGRGSRMKDYDGNKTLLPLLPSGSPYEGRHPILRHIIRNLPPGPKALVVHHRKEEVMAATRSLGLTYCLQPQLNGTGGALLAAREFLEKSGPGRIIITMGDVPLVRKTTYETLCARLSDHSMVILGFRPPDKKQYGVLETRGEQVLRIIEWKYWKTYPRERQRSLGICNSGIYAARKDHLLRYLSILASRPHVIRKTVGGRRIEIREFFITDLVEYMRDDGLSVGHILARDADEVLGVDDRPALEKAQEIFRRRSAPR